MISSKINITLPWRYAEGNITWLDVTVKVILHKITSSDGNIAEY